MNKKQSETTKQITVNKPMANITKTRIAPTMVERTENSKRYFTEVRKYNVLTKEEEVEWFDKYHKETDPKEKQKIRDFLINVNLRYAVRIARQYASNGDNVEDLISEANIGLIQAVEKFDSNRDSSFITCAAFYIRRAINEYNNSHGQFIKVPNMSKNFSLKSKATNAFIQKYQRNPTAQELKDFINTEGGYKRKIKDSTDLMQVSKVSIDVDESDEDCTCYGDLMEFNKRGSSENTYAGSEKYEYNKAFTRSLLETLSERDRKIMEYKFGLVKNDTFHKEYEIQEIAEIMGLTTERVRQIIENSKVKLAKECKQRIGESI